MQRHTRNGITQVPKRLYATQSFEDWLKFFLSRRIIEDELVKTFNNRRNNPYTTDHEMHDVHDSPAWHDFQDSADTPYRLVFGLYGDWFNPFGNRIAGKLLLYLSCKKY